MSWQQGVVPAAGATPAAKEDPNFNLDEFKEHLDSILKGAASGSTEVKNRNTNEVSTLN
jgi:hypothetical protein